MSLPPADQTSISAAAPPRLQGRSFMIEGIVSGAAYGLFLRGYEYVLNQPNRLHWQTLINFDLVMTVAFLVGGPLIMGFLSIHRAEKRQPLSVWQWINLPCLSALIMMLTAALFAWEGAICIIMALPIAFAFGALGGVIGGLLGRHHYRLSTRAITSVALLPFLLSPAESLLRAPTQIRTVESQIRIHAPAAIIWRNIKSVPAIAPAELRSTWTHVVGFPRPVEATLSHEGVGGVRRASFEHGLLFFETVTTWEPERRLAFSIKADTANIPPTTLDEHVTIGGRYFDVLDGEYRLEPLAGGGTLLHLTSHQRLTTDLNGYAGLWTDAVMQTLQTSILEVIQHRCEHAQAVTLARPEKAGR